MKDTCRQSSQVTASQAILWCEQTYYSDITDDAMQQH